MSMLDIEPRALRVTFQLLPPRPRSRLGVGTVQKVSARGWACNGTLCAAARGQASVYIYVYIYECIYILLFYVLTVIHISVPQPNRV